MGSNESRTEVDGNNNQEVKHTRGNTRPPSYKRMYHRMAESEDGLVQKSRTGDIYVRDKFSGQIRNVNKPSRKQRRIERKERLADRKAKKTDERKSLM